MTHSFWHLRSWVAYSGSKHASLSRRSLHRKRPWPCCEVFSKITWLAMFSSPMDRIWIAYAGFEHLIYHYFAEFFDDVCTGLFPLRPLRPLPSFFQSRTMGRRLGVWPWADDKWAVPLGVVVLITIDVGFRECVWPVEIIRIPPLGVTQELRRRRWWRLPDGALASKLAVTVQISVFPRYHGLDG